MGDARVPQRRRMIYTGANRFEFDISQKPPGMAYKWLRVSCGGMEDKENIIMSEMNGWTAVPAKRHPELAGLRARETEAIVRGGLMLVEQPKEYEKEAREQEDFDARNTLETQVQRLGLQARRNGTRGVRRTMEPLDSEEVMG